MINRCFRIDNVFYSILCLFLISLNLFGCGSDEEELPDEVVSPEDLLVGTWELITIDGKTPKADAQQDIGDEDSEVLTAEAKIVFAPNGSLFQEGSITMGD